MYFKTIRQREHFPIADELKHLAPILQQIYSDRKVTSQSQLDSSLAQLADYRLLKNIEQATDCLIEMIEAKMKVVIVGDFDADGATSTALLMLALPRFGLTNIQYVVPNRFEYGYGLSEAIVDDVAALAPDWIITVDNGISNHAGVQRANALGMKVMVTDHHLPPETLPEAEVIVNPNLVGDEFPSKALAGVGVAFYLLIALRAKLRAKNYFQNNQMVEPNLAEWLDLVALGTVADVVPLDDNNRRLVTQGLMRIRRGQCRVGILKLLELGKREYHRVVASDLGFAVGPRLNAAGRLEDMSVGIECLLSDHETNARRLACELDGLNRYRQEIESDMVTQAMTHVQKQLSSFESERPHSLCIYEPEWHQGVVGIVASRVKEKLNRPVIAFAEEDELSLKGSGRSVVGVHLRDVLANISTQHPNVLKKFGGHAMAAGLSILKSDLSTFKQLFENEIIRSLGNETFDETILTDGELNEKDLSLTTAQLLREGGPWGQHFPEPLFHGRFKVVQQRALQNKHLKLIVETPKRQCFDAIFFNAPEDMLNGGLQQVELVYKLDVNEYKQQQSVQFMVEQLQVVEA